MTPSKRIQLLVTSVALLAGLSAPRLAAQIRDPEAELALIRSAQRGSTHSRVAAIESLGAQRAQGAVAFLTGVVAAEPGDYDFEVISAALSALGEIGTPEAFAGLADNRVSPGLSVVRIRALARASVRLTEGAGVPPALQPKLRGLCRQLCGGNHEDAVKIAALNSLVKLSGAGAIDEVAAALSQGTPPVKQAALQAVFTSTDAALTVAVAGRWRQFGEAERTALMDGLVERGAREVRRLAVAALEDPMGSPALRQSAVRVLGRAGSVDDFALLLSLIEARGELAAAAAEALVSLPDPAVNALLRERLAVARPATAAVLLGIAVKRADRGIFDQACLFLEPGGVNDVSLRRAALEALSAFAGPQDLQRLVVVLMGLTDSRECERLAPGLQLAAARQDDPEGAASSLIRALELGEPMQQSVLRTCLASMDTPPARFFLRKQLSLGERPLWRDVIRALGESRLAANITILLEEGRTARNDDRRLALRSLFTLLGSLPPELASLRAEAYLAAWPLAELLEDRQTLLAALRQLRPEAAARLSATGR